MVVLHAVSLNHALCENWISERDAFRLTAFGCGFDSVLGKAVAPF
jgi:hypothetical protein